MEADGFGATISEQKAKTMEAEASEISSERVHEQFCRGVCFSPSFGLSFDPLVLLTVGFAGLHIIAMVFFTRQNRFSARYGGDSSASPAIR